MTYRYCLFDLDGTLTDPGIGITNSVMYALKKFDIIEPDRKKLYPFIGPPLLESFQKYYGFTEIQANDAIEYYREYFRAGGIFENSVYEGIPEMLGELKRREVFIALATSKPYEFALEILKHFDLYQYFDYVGAATMDGRISKKADVIRHLLGELGDIDARSVLMIGDRDQDIEGAKANGLHCVGVLWGYGSNDELMGAGADYIVSAPSDILSL
jgi:phosphoglycolate phosphatase